MSNQNFFSLLSYLHVNSIFGVCEQVGLSAFPHVSTSLSVPLIPGVLCVMQQHILIHFLMNRNNNKDPP